MAIGPQNDTALKIMATYSVCTVIIMHAQLLALQRITELTVINSAL